MDMLLEVLRCKQKKYLAFSCTCPRGGWSQGEGEGYVSVSNVQVQATGGFWDAMDRYALQILLVFL